MGVRPDEAGCIVCPLHRYRFCLEDGYETQGRGRLYLFPIKEVEHEVFVFL
jgi:nitrite reductase/ring-hydroxylating ferredoxin subunit